MKTHVKGFLTAMLFLILLHSQCMADGIHIPRKIATGISPLIHLPHQKAVISWDPGTKKEVMILSTNAKAETLTDLCWIIPIESSIMPVVDVSDLEIFRNEIFRNVAKQFLKGTTIPLFYGWGILGEYYNPFNSFGVVDARFRNTAAGKETPPLHLFKIGPRYAQIFEPHRFLFYAEYGDSFPEFASVEDFLLTDTLDKAFITDPNEIRKAWAADSGVAVTDPNFAQQVNQWAISGNSNPLFDQYGVDFNVPVFANPNYRLARNPFLTTPANQVFSWELHFYGIGGTGLGGTQYLVPLTIDPYDGMPTFIPTYYRAERATDLYGISHFGPTACSLLEGALWNAGFAFWPGIASLDFTPQVYVDLILTIEVTVGSTSDFETFPLSVVSYPCENYPPYIEDVEDQVFYTGTTNRYALSCVDPDCMVFSLSPFLDTGHKPATYEGFRKDMDSISWQISLGNMPSYIQDFYGPLQEGFIDPQNGLICLFPYFEGAFDAIVLATDAGGGSCHAEFTIACIGAPSNMLENRPPVIKKGLPYLFIIKAGEVLRIDSEEAGLYDPDGDRLFATSTIGAISRVSENRFIWTFFTYFPGVYDTQFLFYDKGTAYAELRFQVRVCPWWAY